VISLQEHIITQSGILLKSRRCFRRGQNEYYISNLRILYDAIPDKFKDNKTKKFQTELFKLHEVSPIWIVPEELLSKKRTLKNIIDTEQQFLNPNSHNTNIN